MSIFDRPATMPFGKYKGRPVSELPPSYIEWCLENLDHINGWLRRAMLQVLGEDEDEDEYEGDDEKNCDEIINKNNISGAIENGLARVNGEGKVIPRTSPLTPAEEIAALKELLTEKDRVIEQLEIEVERILWHQRREQQIQKEMDGIYDAF